MEKNQEKKSSQIRSIAKALTIIDLLTSNQEGLPLAQIALKTGNAKSTVHGLLSTLRDFGYVEQSPFTGNYKLGMRLFEIGSVVAKCWDVRAVGAPYIQQLVNEINETVHLVVLDRGEVLYIDKRESAKNLRIVSEIGMRLPAHCTGVGKVLMAYLTEAEVKLIVKKKGLSSYTKNTITDFDTLKNELIKIREQGFAYDKEEIMDSLCCVAAPIFDHYGKACAALSVSSTTSRFNEHHEQIKEMVINTAKDISESLGHNINSIRSGHNGA
ncbi:IclR family transcriptional regulator [Desulforamulus aquiferis]|uniref:Glycerol operon regulatory protein n=1 Tax=Desulforamulus aquiferis TaxID=1397668 RepID=A0AAW7ZG44_9FIRM|nr:IclR family transcriptional regulator [Desulforamulus aquiferis]MDO7788200.1 IclR family transcriptional regulator [Desulforamulus aquiferis]